jgi:predicted DCC family thiol-disulfide oxidoreductase YuxK
MKAQKVTIAENISGTDLRRHLILWDGDCGFCQQSVEWALKYDQKRQFEATPYQSASSPPMNPELAAACRNAVHVLTTDGKMLKAGRAALFVADRLGLGILARVAMIPPFIWFVELGYLLVAKNRYFFSRILFGKEAPACRIPERK